MGDRKNIRIGEKRNKIEECEDSKEKEKRRYEIGEKLELVLYKQRSLDKGNGCEWANSRV